MWNTDSLWLEVAIVTSLTAVGTHILRALRRTNTEMAKSHQADLFCFCHHFDFRNGRKGLGDEFPGGDTAFCCLISMPFGFPERVLMAGRGSRAISTTNYEAGKRKRNR